MPRRGTGLDTLLELDGQIIVLEQGYWVKFEAWLLDEPTQEVPHGLRYCLTLHDRHNRRLVGFDNAHAVKPPRRARYAGRKRSYDHRHRRPGDAGAPYEFSDAGQLLDDFWREVDRVLGLLERGEKL